MSHIRHIKEGRDLQHVLSDLSLDIVRVTIFIFFLFYRFISAWSDNAPAQTCPLWGAYLSRREGVPDKPSSRLADYY